MDLLAFDLGASSGKSFLGEYHGARLTISEIDRFSHGPIDIQGELFWDVLGMFNSLRNGIRKAKTNGRIIRSIGIDSFSNDFGLLDMDGFFTNQVHCYRDERTKRNAKKIYSIISKQKLHALSGNQNALFGTFMQLASMCLENQSYLLEGAGALLFLPDLFNYFLTGEIASEYTISSVSQMFNYPMNSWSDEIIDIFAFPRKIFADIVFPGTKIGKIQSKSGLSNGNREIDVVAVCEHDTASAFLAAPYGHDAIISSSGTWSLVGTETQTPIINKYTYEHNIANEGGYTGHHRLLKNVMGLWILQECQRHLKTNGTDHSVEDLIRLAAEATPLQFLINPNDEIFFSPGNMPEKIMAYCREHGQGVPETPGEITRCIFDSLAMHYRFVIDEIEEATNRHFSTINVVGGGCQNEMLNQLTANATGRIVYAGPSEATAIGNMMVQMVSHKEIQTIEEGRQVIRNSFVIKEFEPIDQDLFSEKYREYLLMIRH